MNSAFVRPTPAVAAIIIRDREILLVRRGAEPSIGLWSVPGGSIELGETLKEALRREIREETGLEIQIGELAGVSDLIVRKDGEIVFHYVLIDYFASVVSGDPVAASDASECQWVPLSELNRCEITPSLLDRLREHDVIPKEPGSEPGGR